MYIIRKSNLILRCLNLCTGEPGFFHLTLFDNMMYLVWFASTHIVHQHTTRTNIVGMEILNLEVEDLNRLCQLLSTDGIDKCVLTVLKLQFVADLQILRGDPALTLHIEGMLGGTGNGFAIDLNMYQFILLIQEGAGTVNLYAQIILQAAEKRVVRQ